MKRLCVTLTAILVTSAVVPASAQSVQQKNAQGGKTCWFQTDSSRLTGYFDVCTDMKQVQQNVPRRGRDQTTPIVTTDNSPRDSGGGGGGGGGGNGR